MVLFYLPILSISNCDTKTRKLVTGQNIPGSKKLELHSHFYSIPGCPLNVIKDKREHITPGDMVEHMGPRILFCGEPKMKKHMYILQAWVLIGKTVQGCCMYHTQPFVLKVTKWTPRRNAHSTQFYKHISLSGLPYIWNKDINENGSRYGLSFYAVGQAMHSL